MDYDESETCPSCGYVLFVHVLPNPAYGPDPNGGCPETEIDAMRRAGIL